MAIRKLPDGRWVVEYRDPDKSGIAKEYFGRGPEGNKRAEKRNRDMGFGQIKQRRPRKRHQHHTGLDFGDLARSYLDSKEGSIEQSSIDALHFKLYGTILPEIGHLHPSRITPHRMDQYVTKRLKSPLKITISYGPGRTLKKKKIVKDKNGNPKTIKRTTVHREITDIIAILNWSVARQYINRNPLTGYAKPKRDDEVILPPTLSETKAMFHNSPPHLHRAMALSYFTGIRPGAVELLSITWHQVNLDNQTITIISARKGAAKSRIVPIHPDLMPLLQEWKKEDESKTMPEIITYRGRTDTTTKVYQHTNLALHRETIKRLPGIGNLED